MDRPIPTYSIENLLASASGQTVEGFIVFGFEYFAKDIEHLKTSHRHQFYTFILVTSGAGSHDIDFETYDLKPNRLFLIAPGQIHAWNDLKKVSGFVVMFTDTFVALSKGRKIMSAWPLFRNDLPAFVDLETGEAKSWEEECKLMDSEARTPDVYSRDAVFYSLGKLLVRASRLYAAYQRETRPDKVFEFRKLVEKHFVRKKTPSDYASLLHVSPNHLNAIVKKLTGKSAGEIIRERVILEAKRLLAHTTLSVSEIAYQLGFSDNSYFGRFFRRQTKQTPEGFRRAIALK